MIKESFARAVRVPQSGTLALACLGLVLGLSQPAFADPSDLAGSWSGGGAVQFASGAKEKARCRAQFSRAGGSSYAMSATCATSSARVAQTASLKKTGSNSYAGQFHNPEYGVTGSIRITVNGRSQNVTLTSDAASANFRLSKL